MMNQKLKLFIFNALSIVCAYGSMKQNVLLIMVDDLKPALGCYGDPHAITPNIDQLAKEGLRFDLAYCNQAVCAASRYNLMLGSLSTSSGLHGLFGDLRKKYPDAVTLPQHFKSHGYSTQAIGKVYHIGHGNFGDTESFDNYYKDKVVEYVSDNSRKSPITKEEAMFNNLRGVERSKYLKNNKLSRGAYKEVLDVPDEAYADGRVAQKAIEFLQKQQTEDSPFFFSRGFCQTSLTFYGT